MSRLTALASLVVLLVSTGSAQAGPPCLCWPFAHERENDLPLTGHKEVSAAQAVETALELLEAEQSVFVRMEVLRRVVMRIRRDEPARDALLARLMQRALDGEAANRPSVRAWFDAAYAQAAFRQLGVDHLGDGYAWMKRALALSKGDPRIEFAAALIALDARGDLEQHQAAAERAEADDALLARNLEMLRENANLKRVEPAK